MTLRTARAAVALFVSTLAAELASRPEVARDLNAGGAASLIREEARRHFAAVPAASSLPGLLRVLCEIELSADEVAAGEREARDLVADALLSEVEIVEIAARSFKAIPPSPFRRGVGCDSRGSLASSNHPDVLRRSARRSELVRAAVETAKRRVA